MKRNECSPPKDDPIHRKKNKPSPFEESGVLQSIIGRRSIASFLKNTYQLRPHIFHVDTSDGDISPTLKAVYGLGWNGVSSMLHKSQRKFNDFHTSTDGDQAVAASMPLFFRNQEPVQIDEIKSMYGNSPFAAYLDGCSIVNNHADLLLPPLAALCVDLQKSIPHAYVNTYLTPPSAAAVQAHADDRDVFVIQILGEKKWKVYEEIPIPYPFPHEQVGKGGLPVPASVLQQKPLYEIMLKQGDVLYMPRGFVHEASTNPHEPSFHATVAIATHDWSLSKTIKEIVTEKLDSMSKFRMAVHPHFGMRNVDCIDSIDKKLDALIKDAIGTITSSVNVETVSNHLEKKYRSHNQLVSSKRQEMIQNSLHDVSHTPDIALVGLEAAEQIQMNTKLRAGTEEEKASVPPPVATRRGLTVREETFTGLISVLSILKEGNKSMEVREFKQHIPEDSVDMVCDLTLLSFAKCCVELGALALVIL